VPVTVDYSKRTVTQAGEPKFHLWAVKQIIVALGLQIKGDGRDFDTELEKTFGMLEWTKFVSSGFDLKVLEFQKMRFTRSVLEGIRSRLAEGPSSYQ